MRRKVKIKLLSKCSNKLALCKLIKECTRLGLKEAKDITDDICDNIGIVREITISDEYQRGDELIKPLELLKSKLKDIGNFEFNSGVSWERELKMLSLGIGDNDDYVMFILEYSSLLGNEGFEKLLKTVLSKLDKKELIDIVNKIKV